MSEARAKGGLVFARRVRQEHAHGAQLSRRDALCARLPVPHALSCPQPRRTGLLSRSHGAAVPDIGRVGMERHRRRRDGAERATLALGTGELAPGSKVPYPLMGEKTSRASSSCPW